MQKYNILITGANGLLGRAVCLRLKDSHNIHALVHRLPKEELSNITYHTVDLASFWNAENLPETIDIVIHLAQSPKFREFPEEVMNVFDVNVRSTALLLDYARKAGAKHFICASSGGVYGSGNNAFGENAPIHTNRHLGYYLGSKLCGEILARNYASLMTVSILRFFFMYGPRQKRSMLLPRLVDNIRAGKPVQLQGKDGLSINPIHVRDAAACFNKLIEAEISRTINIAGPDVLSLKQIAGMIGEAVGRDPVFEYTDSDPRSLVADTSLMEDCFGKPQISFEKGLKDLL